MAAHGGLAKTKPRLACEMDRKQNNAKFETTLPRACRVTLHSSALAKKSACSRYRSAMAEERGNGDVPPASTPLQGCMGKWVDPPPNLQGIRDSRSVLPRFKGPHGLWIWHGIKTWLH